MFSWSYYNIIEDSPYAAYYKLIAYLTYNWKCVPLKSLHLFCSIYHPPPLWLFPEGRFFFHHRRNSEMRWKLRKKGNDLFK